MKYYPTSEKLNVLDNPKAKGYKLAEDDALEVVHLNVKPGGSIPMHALPIKVSFYVISGSGTALNDDRKQEVHAGDVLSIDANTQRGWENHSSNDLELLVIKQVK